ncbi:hypothetical protein ABHF33_14010 [Chitinibacter sp. FCG-7]|uniref:Lipoprotein n=1 Tax=Chitinibacter mangrovi TaxID=3153927 RepID=A0AAU7F651_9NEIS
MIKNRLFLFFLVSILAACARTEPVTGTKTPNSAQTADDKCCAKIVNYTQHPGVLLTATIAGKDYYSYVAKLTFDILPNGELKRAEQQEETFGAEEQVADTYACTFKGAEFNQNTAWYPYTGFLVTGGKLLAVKDSAKKPMKLRKMTRLDSDAVMTQGSEARKSEYSYAPCVGKVRVESGQRLDSYFPIGGSMHFALNKRQRMNISLPKPMEPFLLLRYHSGALIPTPMRPVLFSINLTEKKLVVQYQSTIERKEPIRTIESRAINPEGEKDESETEARYQQRTKAFLDDLWSCPIPTTPGEPCASAKRIPNPLMFQATAGK